MIGDEKESEPKIDPKPPMNERERAERERERAEMENLKKNSKPRKFRLGDDDPLFKRIRGMAFGAVRFCRYLLPLH